MKCVDERKRPSDFALVVLISTCLPCSQGEHVQERLSSLLLRYGGLPRCHRSGPHPARPDTTRVRLPPAELVARDDLQRALAGRFSSIGHASGSGRAVITGPVGSGKTSLVRRFCDDVAKHLIGTRDIAVAHINCRNENTTMQVMHKIVAQMDERHPDRGLSSGELLASIRRLVSARRGHLIVVLDEVDHLLRRAGNDILYHLLRIDEDAASEGTLSLILISQEQILDVLEGAVISRLGASNHLRIPAYNREELTAIAEQRATLALRPGSWQDTHIALIAKRPPPTAMHVRPSNCSTPPCATQRPTAGGNCVPTTSNAQQPNFRAPMPTAWSMS